MSSPQPADTLEVRGWLALAIVAGSYLAVALFGVSVGVVMALWIV